MLSETNTVTLSKTHYQGTELLRFLFFYLLFLFHFVLISLSQTLKITTERLQFKER